MAKSAAVTMEKFAGCLDSSELTNVMSESSNLYDKHLGNETMDSAGWIVGNLMGAQAAFRQLAPGKTRQAPTARCDTGVAQRPHMSVDPKMKMLLQRLAGAA